MDFLHCLRYIVGESSGTALKGAAFSTQEELVDLSTESKRWQDVLQNTKKDI